MTSATTNKPIENLTVNRRNRFVNRFGETDRIIHVKCADSFRLFRCIVIAFVQFLFVVFIFCYM